MMKQHNTPPPPATAAAATIITHNTHKRMRACLISISAGLVMLLAPPNAQAQGFSSNPLIFAREMITIQSAQPAVIAQAISPKNTADNNSAQAASSAPNTPAQAPLRAPASAWQFNVEVRPEDALRLDYIQALTTLKDTTGVMIAFGAPTIVPLPYFRVQQPTDVLFVDNEGVILQIYPGHIPIDLSREIYANKPVKAFIYLKAGMVAQYGIRPRDVVQSTVFNPPPPLLQ
jgi:uncharacterized membrane protein (UPF0127 family)